MKNIMNPFSLPILFSILILFSNANNFAGEEEINLLNTEPATYSHSEDINDYIDENTNDQNTESWTEEPVGTPGSSEKTSLKANVHILKTIILLSSKEDLSPPNYKEKKGVISYNLNIPGPFCRLQKHIFSLYNKRPLTEDLLLEIKKTILLFYQNNGHPLITIETPNQDISDGILQLIITESTLGEYIIKDVSSGKKSCLNIDKNLTICPGSTINSNVLNKDIMWLNRSLFNNVSAIYAPGIEANTTDIELYSSNRFPLRIYAGINNYGNDVTGNNRLFAGLSFGFDFLWDQVFTYQYNTDDEFKRLQAHTFYYTHYLPWKHELTLFGTYSYVNAEYAMTNVAVPFHTKGAGIQASCRYNIPFTPINSYLHEMSLGFDFKRTNNNLTFGGEPASNDNGKYVNLTQFMGGYNLGYNKDNTNVSFNIEGFGSPGRWISDQTNTRYHLLREFSKNYYFYMRSALSYNTKILSGCSFAAFVRAQYSTQNLLTSEQYGLGGYDTVRGYKERIYNADDALVINLDIKSPQLPIFSHFTKTKINDYLQLLVFFDFGWGKKNKPGQDELKETTIYSMGPGIRYNINPYIMLRADYGFQLKKLSDFYGLGSNDKRLHFSLTAGY